MLAFSKSCHRPFAMIPLRSYKWQKVQPTDQHDLGIVNKPAIPTARLGSSGCERVPLQHDSDERLLPEDNGGCLSIIRRRFPGFRFGALVIAFFAFLSFIANTVIYISVLTQGHQKQDDLVEIFRGDCQSSEVRFGSSSSHQYNKHDPAQRIELWHAGPCRSD